MRKGKRALAGSRRRRESLMVPRCVMWHLSTDQHYICRASVVCVVVRLSACALARCVYSVQRGLGFVVQMRLPEECQEIARLLMVKLGNFDLVAMVLDYDHGGSVEDRGRLSSKVARTLLARIEDSSAFVERHLFETRALAEREFA